MERILTQYKEITGGEAITMGYNRPYQRLKLFTNSLVTLASNISITMSGGSVMQDEQVSVLVDCDIDLNGNSFTIFGKRIWQELIDAGPFMVIGICGGDKIDQVLLFTNFSGTNFINEDQMAADAIATAAIQDTAVTLAKLVAPEGKGRILIANSAGTGWEQLNASTAGNLLITNSAQKIASVTMSGDATMDDTGAVTIADGAVTPAKLSFSLESYLTTTVTLSQSDIQALYSSPYDVLPAPGVNNYYEVISATAYMNYDTTAYANGTDLLELQISGTKFYSFPNSFTETTADVVCQGTKTADALIPVNKGIKLTTTSADPTGGGASSSLRLDLIYVIKSIA